jgi:hypothetical protein
VREECEGFGCFYRAEGGDRSAQWWGRSTPYGSHSGALSSLHCWLKTFARISAGWKKKSDAGGGVEEKKRE